MYGVFLAEVSVNTETGKVAVDKMTLMADIGKINNRLVTGGQLYGGIAQDRPCPLGGFRGHRETLLSSEEDSLRQDIPDNIEIVYFENYPREFGPFGAAGVGELPLSAACSHWKRDLLCLWG